MEANSKFYGIVHRNADDTISFLTQEATGMVCIFEDAANARAMFNHFPAYVKMAEVEIVIVNPDMGG